MKRLFLSLALSAAAFGGIAAVRVVDNPLIGATTANNLDFTRVELSDTATRVRAYISFRPRWWVRIASKSYLETPDGQRYALLRGEGINPDEEHYMPDSGVDEFTLVFEPLPVDTESFSFKEDTETGWQIFDVRLDGGPADGIPDGLPAEFRDRSITDVELPAPMLAVDSSTVRFHVLGYNPEMGERMTYYVNYIHGQDSDTKPIELNRDGEGEVTLLMPGTAQVSAYRIGKIPVSGHVWVNPGETVDLYIDPSVSGYYAMSHRENDNRPQRSWSWSNGKMASVIRALSEIPPHYFMNLHSGHFADWHWTADQYVDTLLNRYDTLSERIKADESLSPLAREAALDELNASTVSAMTRGSHFLLHNFLREHKNYSYSSAMDSISAVFEPRHYQAVAGKVDINDPRLLMALERPDDLVGPEWAKAGVDSHMLDEIAAYIDAYGKADSGRLTDAEIDSIRGLSIPFYADALSARNERMKEVLSQFDRSLCLPTPDVADDCVFDAIIAPLKGKVVLVDLWNTWCGPCRAALAENEPEKSGDLGSDDIVWVYLADESSPEPKYFEMIPGIRGMHYRLTSDQMQSIRKRFDVDGIPFYITVDRHGIAARRPDLRDHSLLKSTLLKMVGK